MSSAVVFAWCFRPVVSSLVLGLWECLAYVILARKIKFAIGVIFLLYFPTLHFWTELHV